MPEVSGGGGRAERPKCFLEALGGPRDASVCGFTESWARRSGAARTVVRLTLSFLPHQRQAAQATRFTEVDSRLSLHKASTSVWEKTQFYGKLKRLFVHVGISHR